MRYVGLRKYLRWMRNQLLRKYYVNVCLECVTKLLRKYLRRMRELQAKYKEDMKVKMEEDKKKRAEERAKEKERKKEEQKIIKELMQVS